MASEGERLLRQDKREGTPGYDRDTKDGSDLEASAAGGNAGESDGAGHAAVLRRIP